MSHLSHRYFLTVDIKIKETEMILYLKNEVDSDVEDNV